MAELHKPEVHTTTTASLPQRIGRDARGITELSQLPALAYYGLSSAAAVAPNRRAVATRFAKRAHVFHGTVTVAAIRLWLRA
ncbi:hypothetical protein AB0L99_44125 [Streptomyces sp. NPDC051954]|uniref:hypothetical protein n=1 Tax=Streptomyces sp. NPDC051954 TaxID=3155524 RepID=UPI003422C8B9